MLSIIHPSLREQIVNISVYTMLDGQTDHFMTHVHVRTGPKLRFPTCPAYQNMTFPHISYTYLAEDRAGFYAMCRKSCPILLISYMYEIQNFVQ